MKRPLIAVASGLALLLAGCNEILNTQASGTGPAGPGPIPGAPSWDSVEAIGDVLFNGGKRGRGHPTI